MHAELAETNKQEVVAQEETEQIRSQKVFVPKADIYEGEEQLVLLADIPGVKKDGIEITLEQNVLTIYGRVDEPQLSGYSLTYSEYGVGDYRRVFALSNEINRDEIQATVKNGVLRLVLPKSTRATPRKISVSA